MNEKKSAPAQAKQKLPFSKYMVLGDGALIIPILLAYIIVGVYGAKTTMKDTIAETTPETAAIIAYSVEDEAKGDIQAALDGAVEFGAVSPETGVQVLDKTGAVVADNGKTTCDLTKLKTAIASGDNGAETIKQGGKKFTVAYAPIQGSNGMSVVIMVPLSSFNGHFTSMWLLLAGMTLFFILFAAWGIRRSVGYMVGPMTVCVNQLNSMAKGNFETPTPEIDAHCQELEDIRNATETLRENTHAVISDIDYTLGEMAGGNFTVTSAIPEKYIGEYEDILRAEKKIKTELTQTLTEILNISNQVSEDSELVSSGAQNLAQGATEQASSVEELSATISDVARQIGESAENAEKANTLTVETGAIMEGTVQAMTEAKQAMDEITTTSHDISKVIKTIDDIAFQTNILALNAAVEAARAGTAGKGFAVVADEVRNLSQKSAEAAKNTTALIETSISAVEKGGELVNKANTNFAQVADKSTQINGIVSELADQFKQQADATNQISIGIEQVASVVQINSATSEESAAASEELSGQANILKQLVSNFRLEK